MTNTILSSNQRRGSMRRYTGGYKLLICIISFFFLFFFFFLFNSVVVFFSFCFSHMSGGYVTIELLRFFQFTHERKPSTEEDGDGTLKFIKQLQNSVSVFFFFSRSFLEYKSAQRYAQMPKKNNRKGSTHL